MNIAGLCGLILTIAVACVMLRRYAPEYSFMIEITSGAVILAAILSKFMPVIYEIRNLLNTAKIPEEYGTILFKSIGICFLTQFASDSCKDAGESSLASKVELAGKIAIIIASLPLFEKIAKTAISLMGR